MLAAMIPMADAAAAAMQGVVVMVPQVPGLLVGASLPVGVMVMKISAPALRSANSVENQAAVAAGAPPCPSLVATA